MASRTSLSALLVVALLGSRPASADSLHELISEAMGPSVHGSGVIKTDTRQLDSFEVIKSKGSIDLDVKIGPQYAVVVEADENLFGVIRTEVSGGALVVDSKGSWSSKHGTVVHVTLPKLTAIGVDGSGDVRLSGFSGDKLGVKIEGSGDVVGNGHVQNLHVVIEGSGDADLEKLDADDVQVRIDGSGDASVTAEKTLDITIHGSGDVTWRGNAPQANSQVYGSGDIVKKE